MRGKSTEAVLRVAKDLNMENGFHCAPVCRVILFYLKSKCNKYTLLVAVCIVMTCQVIITMA